MFRRSQEKPSIAMVETEESLRERLHEQHGREREQEAYIRQHHRELSGIPHDQPEDAEEAHELSFNSFGPALGNFSIQYNLSCAGIALQIMNSCSDDNGPACKEGDYPEPDWAKYTLLGLVFAGAVAGMLTMGYLGDLLGRRRALLLTLSLTVLGSLGCALLSWGPPETMYTVICAFRFILGIGVGGIYPLSAVSSAETAKHDGHDARRVGWAFFWQAPGAMAPYIVALALLSLHGPTDASGKVPSLLQPGLTSFQFRIIMGLGALPASIVLWLTWIDQRLEEKAINVPVGSIERQPSAPLEETMSHRNYFWRLIGTGGTWFLYDVAYYGTSVFLPQILATIFKEEGEARAGGDLPMQCWQAILVTAIGVPGCVCAISLIDPPRGPRWLLIVGFGTMTLAFSLLAIAFERAKDQQLLVIALFCFVSFSMNFGPNVATYVLPTQIYPQEVRATFHGLSAGAGKLGAVVGTFIYQPIADAFGLPAVMWTQALVCVLAMLLSRFFIPPDEALPSNIDAAEGESLENPLLHQDHPSLSLPRNSPTNEHARQEGREPLLKGRDLPRGSVGSAGAAGAAERLEGISEA